jgi:hypothetical protein
MNAKTDPPQEFSEQSGVTVPQLDRVDLVLDTNVLLEIASAELVARGDALGSPEAIAQSADFRSWQLRAKYSLVLAWYCHTRKKTTLGLGDEPLEILRRNIPPESKSPAVALTHVIAHLVLEGLLGGWRGHACGDDELLLRGSTADLFLLRLAKGYGVPLITNEGLSPVRLREKGNLRARCRHAGVRVCSPKEYLHAQGVDVASAARDFCETYDALALRTLGGDVPDGLGGRGLEDALRWLSSFYRFVLLDVVDPAHEAPRPEVVWDAAQLPAAEDDQGATDADHPGPGEDPQR